MTTAEERRAKFAATSSDLQEAFGSRTFTTTEEDEIQRNARILGLFLDIMEQLDSALADSKMSKNNLADVAHVRADVVRRLMSKRSSNMRALSLLNLIDALGLEILLKPKTESSGTGQPEL